MFCQKWFRSRIIIIAYSNIQIGFERMKMWSWLWSFNPRNSRTICNSWCATNIFIFTYAIYWFF